MSLAYDDIAHSKHTEDHPCSEEFCLPKCQHSQERQGAASAERAARRIINAWNNCLLDDAPQPDVESIAAIIREEVAQNVCGLNCSCHEDGELCHQCCMVPARSSGEPKGDSK